MLNNLKSRLADWPAVRAALPGVSPSMQRLLLPLLLTAAIVTAVVVMLLWQNSDNYRPLFGARENIAVSDVPMFETELYSFIDSRHPEL